MHVGGPSAAFTGHASLRGVKQAGERRTVALEARVDARHPAHMVALTARLAASRRSRRLARAYQYPRKFEVGENPQRIETRRTLTERLSRGARCPEGAPKAQPGAASAKSLLCALCALCALCVSHPVAQGSL
jgi:hypothetical protein